jgi:hypothetical protein
VEGSPHGRSSLLERRGVPVLRPAALRDAFLPPAGFRWLTPPANVGCPSGASAGCPPGLMPDASPGLMPAASPGLMPAASPGKIPGASPRESEPVPVD